MLEYDFFYLVGQELYSKCSKAFINTNSFSWKNMCLTLQP